MDAKRQAAAGRLTAVVGVAGAALALAIMAWPHQVPQSRWSYPFDATSYTGAQVIFGLHHALLIPGMVAVLALARSTATRATLVGLRMIVGFTAMSSVVELIGIGAAEVSKTSSFAGVMGMLYAVFTLGLGVGLLLAGVGFRRSPLLPSPVGRWLYLAIGVWTFFPMLPSFFMPLVFGRITIGTWYLGFALIGVGIVRLTRTPEPAPVLSRALLD